MENEIKMDPIGKIEQKILEKVSHIAEQLTDVISKEKVQFAWSINHGNTITRAT